MIDGAASAKGATRMYAVIFRAKIREFDEQYVNVAARMRELALNHFGCKEFVATCEGGYEIAISYWETLEHIKQWKQHAEHLVAQEQGRSHWYKNYKVQIVEIVREYEFP